MAGGDATWSCMHLSDLDTVQLWESRDSRWRKVLLLLLRMLATGLATSSSIWTRLPKPLCSAFDTDADADPDGDTDHRATCDLLLARTTSPPLTDTSGMLRPSSRASFLTTKRSAGATIEMTVPCLRRIMPQHVSCNTAAQSV